jgi:hypothetical protein
MCLDHSDGIAVLGLDFTTFVVDFTSIDTDGCQASTSPLVHAEGTAALQSCTGWLFSEAWVAVERHRGADGEATGLCERVLPHSICHDRRCGALLHSRGAARSTRGRRGAKHTVRAQHIGGCPGRRRAVSWAARQRGGAAGWVGGAEGGLRPCAILHERQSGCGAVALASRCCSSCLTRRSRGGEHSIGALNVRCRPRRGDVETRVAG